ncbi:MAG: hypothetical protein ACOX1P_23240 [Thermoguttaceae bacterium]|jgi:hypothetical protein
MNRPYHVLSVLGLLVCALGVIGCAGRSLETVYVEGVVTLDGKPVSGATVTFVPVKEQGGVSATGSTDESGIYKLTAVGAGAVKAEAGTGTLPGEYYVGVDKTIVDAPSDDLPEEVRREAQQSGKGRPRPPAIKYVVPKKYNNPKESGLKVTVKEGENNIPIELTSK